MICMYHGFSEIFIDFQPPPLEINPYLRRELFSSFGCWKSWKSRKSRKTRKSRNSRKSRKTRKARKTWINEFLDFGPKVKMSFSDSDYDPDFKPCYDSSSGDECDDHDEPEPPVQPIARRCPYHWGNPAPWRPTNFDPPCDGSSTAYARFLEDLWPLCLHVGWTRPVLHLIARFLFRTFPKLKYGSQTLSTK